MAIINTWVVALLVIHEDKYHPTPAKKKKTRFSTVEMVGDLINSWIYMHQVLSHLWIKNISGKKNKKEKTKVFKPGFETWSPNHQVSFHWHNDIKSNQVQPSPTP